MMTRLTAVSIELPRWPQEGSRRLSCTRLATTWLTPAIRRQASRGVTIISTRTPTILAKQITVQITVGAFNV